MNTIENYNVIKPGGVGYNSGVIEAEYSVLGGVLDTRDINKGETLMSSITTPLKLQFSTEDPPEWNRLYDFVDNTDSLMIISNRVKKIFENANVIGVEYIPAQILNQEGTIIGQDYSVVNILNRQPIIDMEKSEYSRFYVDGSIENIKKLCLDISEVDSEAKLFLSTADDYTYFITDDVLQEMKLANITGLGVNKAEGWDGFGFFYVEPQTKTYAKDKVERVLQIFEEKSIGRGSYRDVSYLDIALGESCIEKDFVKILKNKKCGVVASLAYELWEYKGFKDFSKETKQLVLINKYDIRIEEVEKYTDIRIKPILEQWMSHDSDILPPDRNYYLEDNEDETTDLEVYTRITNWILNHNDFKPNLAKSSSIVKWAKRLSKLDAHAYAAIGTMLLEKLGMLEPNKVDTSKMGWMELLIYKLTDSCKGFIESKEKKIHGVVLSYGQDHFSCWCDYKEKEGLSLRNTDDWINGADESEVAIDCYMDDLPFDEDDQTVNDIAYLMVSIIMTKVVINLKKDETLKTNFSKNLLIGMDLDQTNQKPTFYGNYFGRYDPDSRTVKKILKEYVSDKESKALIEDLIKKEPVGPGLELWNELTYAD